MRSRFICFVALCLLALPAWASEIRAVVNSEIITDYDVGARVKLALVSSGIPDTPQARKSLTSQVLRSLIDERLQLQEAERLKIRVTDDEVAKGLMLLEQQNRMQPNELKKILQQNSVPLATLEQQIRASIGWGKLVQGRFARRAVVSDSEVKATLDRMQASMGKPEYRVGEILIPTGAGTSSEAAQTAARRLFDQIMKGTSFASLARQFSGSPTASVGGDMGWIIADDLDPPFDRLVTQMQPGQISSPIETPDGYRIIVLAERRLVGMTGTAGNATVNLHQLVFPVPAKASEAKRQAIFDKAKTLASQVRGCPSAERVAKAESLPLSGALGSLQLSDLPASVQQAVLQTETGRATQPLQIGQSWAVMTVCDKAVPASRMPSANDIRDQLRIRKVERLAQQYLRDLRQGAYISVRDNG